MLRLISLALLLAIAPQDSFALEETEGRDVDYNKPMVCHTNKKIWYSLELDLSEAPGPSANESEKWFQSPLPSLLIHHSGLAAEFRRIEKRAVGNVTFPNKKNAVLTVVDYQLFVSERQVSNAIHSLHYLSEGELRKNLPIVEKNFEEFCRRELMNINTISDLRNWYSVWKLNDTPFGKIFDLFLASAYVDDKKFSSLLIDATQSNDFKDPFTEQIIENRDRIKDNMDLISFL